MWVIIFSSASLVLVKSYLLFFFPPKIAGREGMNLMTANGKSHSSPPEDKEPRTPLDQHHFMWRDSQIAVEFFDSESPALPSSTFHIGSLTLSWWPLCQKQPEPSFPAGNRRSRLSQYLRPVSGAVKRIATRFSPSF
ncbi:hypothetical protein BX666DRAFT_851810 [Dichotomocladium elegans]|nr:hypothetical protein BX666DRAFT_851810 [Dichotomocladium elegans]